MYLYLYIDISVFVHISTPSAEQPWILPCAWHRRALALKLRLLWERESSVSHQSSADRYLVIRKGISPHSAGTLLMSPITTLPNYFLSNLPKSLRNYTSSGKKGRKQLNATIIIMEHTITHPTPIFPKQKRFTWWSLVSHKFRVFFLSVVNFVCKWVSLRHGCKGIRLKAYNWTNLLWPNAS